VRLQPRHVSLWRLPLPRQLERSITALASKDDYTFAAYGPHVAVFRRRVRAAARQTRARGGM
jgi:hypothetical protein